MAKPGGLLKKGTPMAVFKFNTTFFIVFGIMLGYTLLLYRIGYLLLTPVFLFSLIFVFSPRNNRIYWKIALISILTTIVTHVVFRQFFYVMIPGGLLG